MVLSILIIIKKRIKIIKPIIIFTNFSNSEDDPKEFVELKTDVNPLASLGIRKKIRPIRTIHNGNQILDIIF